MEELVLKTISEQNLIQPGDRILIGVSGGADSMALLHLMIGYRRQLQCEIAVAHLHHDMRGAVADGDALYVEAFCKKHQVPFYFSKTNVFAFAQDKKIGIEEAGRIARYDFFYEVMAREDYNKLALAHHLNDQAETLLMRLIRGTGLTGAVGMRLYEGNLIRPLLRIPRVQIEKYCIDHQIDYRHDSTNDDDSLTRNRLRHRVMPELLAINPGADVHLADFCRDMAETDRFMIQMVERAAKEVLAPFKAGVRLDIPLFREQPIVIGKGLLRKVIGMVGENMIDVERRHIELLLNYLLNHGSRWSVDLPHGVHVERWYECLEFTKGRPTGEKLTDITPVTCAGIYLVGDYRFTVSEVVSEKRKSFQNEKKPYKFYISCGKIKSGVFFRARQSGDRMMLRNRSGHKSIKKIMIDEKVPASIRDGIPILVSNEEVLWIPGVAVSGNCGFDGYSENYYLFTMETNDEQGY